MLVDDTHKVFQNCDEKNDIYYPICRKLRILCPRLVPSPLWGLSIANISRMSPQAALAICDSCSEIIEKISQYWMSLNRSGKCEVCNNAGREIDEVWLYCVTDENGNIVSNITTKENFTLTESRLYKGIAYLQRLELLCEKCHLAKHQGYALVQGRKQEALEQLAHIHKLDLNKTEELVEEAFIIHIKLSEIKEWTIKIGELNGLDKELRLRVEELLNIMYRKGFFVREGWLYYQYPNYYQEVEPRIIQETMTVLAKTSNKAGTTNVADKWTDSLLEIIREELEPKGIRVLPHEFKLFIKYLLKDEKLSSLLQGRSDLFATDIFSLDYDSLKGKWMVFVPTDLYPKIFRYMLEALEKAKLAYSAKIVSSRDQYTSKRELPIIIYVPVSFAASYIAEVAKVMKNTLESYHISKNMYFKPDLFTKKGMHSGNVNHRPYIYVY